MFSVVVLLQHNLVLQPDTIKFIGQHGPDASYSHHIQCLSIMHAT